MLNLNGLRGLGNLLRRCGRDTKRQLEKCECVIEGHWLLGRGDADSDQEEGDTCAGDRRRTAWLEQKEEESVSYLGQHLAGKQKVVWPCGRKD